ncbi:aspartyl protease APCB1 isoform X2 [Physcomitrium patens]|uniref:aspartyl protease APCB1 isoform X2 n=1 Tax=Physcomitrium patens TaxID=3218 RepID=UPI000D16A9A4|nr:aspartyl protease APCB1-like isoform X2 [Physcomitrium patens]|eukprot:XP_024379978.1 aspartyl protease APCB1-like isoform X2 [Physcomitrella patens]
MRRGGCGEFLQTPLTPRDGPIPSAVNFESWGARRFWRLTIIVACSMIIYIIIWSSQLGPPSTSIVPAYHLGSKKSGFVFPLHRHRSRFPDASDVMEGGMRRGRRAASRRESEEFHVEMKLGVPPKKFHFHMDTGSRDTWVYCQVSRNLDEPPIELGPNGKFEPRDESSYIQCIGHTASLCSEYQYEPHLCNSVDKYHCVNDLNYADDSTYSGVLVNESLMVSTIDNSDMDAMGLFWCINEASHPFTGTDGIIGLGNCKKTLGDQWTTNKVISQNVLGVCLAKGPGPVGYISLGVNFKKKFEESTSVWSKLTPMSSAGECAYSSPLASISFHDKTFVFTSETNLGFDTGSDMMYLEAVIYEPLLDMLDSYATSRGYVRVEDSVAQSYYVHQSEQRQCWAPPAKMQRALLTKASPISHFHALTFTFKGIPRATGHSSDQNLIVEPASYLSWNAPERKLCANIILSPKDSDLGAIGMKGHLFVFDVENQKVQWKVDACTL